MAYLCITSKAAYESPRSAAMTHLTLRLAEDALCETAYLADVAGLSYDVCFLACLHLPARCVHDRCCGSSATMQMSKSGGV